MLLLLGQVWDRRREEMLQHLTFSSLWIVPNLKSVFPLMTPYFVIDCCILIVIRYYYLYEVDYLAFIEVTLGT